MASISTRCTPNGSYISDTVSKAHSFDSAVQYDPAELVARSMDSTIHNQTRRLTEWIDSTVHTMTIPLACSVDYKAHRTRVPLNELTMGPSRNCVNNGTRPESESMGNYDVVPQSAVADISDLGKHRHHDDTGCHIDLDIGESHQMDAIDLSNVCRKFYQARKQAAADVKEKLATSGRQRSLATPKKKPNSLDIAMDTLKTEMASLMDQDLQLMKQLLTLNETIEDLKWQRKLALNQSNSPTSSCDLSMPSDWSILPESEIPEYKRSDSKPIEIALLESGHSRDILDVPGSRYRHRTSTRIDQSSRGASAIDQELQFAIELDSAEQLLSSEAVISEHNSFDSGIHENITPCASQQY